MRADLRVSSKLKTCRKAFDRRAAHGKNIRDEWNPGCDRPKLWQAYGNLVGSELNALSALRVLGNLPDTTYWAYNILTGHRSEIVVYKLSKAKDARLDRWTSVWGRGGCAKQVVGRAGVNGTLTILHRCKQCGPMPKYDFIWFPKKKGRL